MDRLTDGWTDRQTDGCMNKEIQMAVEEGWEGCNLM